MKVGGPGACTTAQVSFQSFADRAPQEAATATAQCLVQKQPASTSGESAADDAVDLLEYSIEILYHNQVSMLYVATTAHTCHQRAAFRCITGSGSLCQLSF